jgi:hypothetical protein
MSEFKKMCFRNYLLDLLSVKIAALQNKHAQPLEVSYKVIEDLVDEIVTNVELNFIDHEDTPLESEHDV